MTLMGALKLQWSKSKYQIHKKYFSFVTFSCGHLIKFLFYSRYRHIYNVNANV